MNNICNYSNNLHSNIYLDIVESEITNLEDNFIVEYRYHEGKIYRISITNTKKYIIKSGFKYKDIVKLLDWLEEPKQIEAVNFIKQTGGKDNGQLL